MASAIACIAYDRLYEHEEAIRALFDHPIEDVRGEAAFHLIGTWYRSDLLDQTCRRALLDPSEFVRSNLYHALANFARGFDGISQETTRQILVTLTAALVKDSEWTIQAPAYRAALDILDNPRAPTMLPSPFNRDQDVDWARLEPYLAEAEALEFKPVEF